MTGHGGPEPPPKGLGWAGLFAFLASAAVFLAGLGFGREIQAARDPCVNEAGIPCPSNRGLFTWAAAIGLSSAVGLGVIALRRIRGR